MKFVSTFLQIIRDKMSRIISNVAESRSKKQIKAAEKQKEIARKRRESTSFVISFDPAKYQEINRIVVRAGVPYRIVIDAKDIVITDQNDRSVSDIALIVELLQQIKGSIE
ncbi:hypothetical protein [Aeromonas salmonicida]|uniref:hypothetical protein n=1 Tax=Aeromonas salmonicida TaxID=645 RepID=UPI000F78547F|nr:hypothetical protein [Aeromonas salmonicida]RSM24954.1 hypothetical protein C5B77_19355 [Aeromonas salmonicida]